MKVYLNAGFIEEQEARVSLFDPGFLYGQGLFETMRAYAGKIFRMDSHIQRLINSAPLINIKLDNDANSLKSILNSCLSENSIKDGLLRLTIWQGKDRVNLAAFARSCDFYRESSYQSGFRVITSELIQNERSPLCKVKSSNYLHLLLAYQEARSKNCDEALLLNSRGFIAEASRANIFMVKDNCLITPSLSCGCLAGITRDTILGIATSEKIRLVETNISLLELKKAEEAFLTNSLIELMPLVAIDGQPIKNGKPGRVTEKIIGRYKALVSAG